MLWDNTEYCVKLSSEELSRYSNKTESAGLRKCPQSLLRKRRHSNIHFSELAPHHAGKTAGMETVRRNYVPVVICIGVHAICGKFLTLCTDWVRPATVSTDAKRTAAFCFLWTHSIWTVCRQPSVRHRTLSNRNCKRVSSATTNIIGHRCGVSVILAPSHKCQDLLTYLTETRQLRLLCNPLHAAVSIDSSDSPLYPICASKQDRIQRGWL